jgi:hypothetical protein
MNTSTNVRNALKAVRHSRRSYDTPHKGWGKRVASRAGRRLNKALSKDVEG